MKHYETLGLTQDATADDIKKAFRRKASEHHPDREGGDPEMMAAVNRAYEVLSDPERRARYDEAGECHPNATQHLVAEAIQLLTSALCESGEDDAPVRTMTEAEQSAYQRGAEEARADAMVNLRFVERWVNHHGQHPRITPQEVLSMIQHYPPIKDITRAYADGKLPPGPDPFEVFGYVMENNKPDDSMFKWQFFTPEQIGTAYRDNALRVIPVVELKVPKA